MKTILFLGNIGTGEIILIALVVLLLWGGKKIPELMKGLGKGVKSFKDGMNEIEKDINLDETPKTEKIIINHKNLIKWEKKCLEDRS